MFRGEGLEKFLFKRGRGLKTFKWEKNKKLDTRKENILLKKAALLHQRISQFFLRTLKLLSRHTFSVTLCGYAQEKVAL